MPLRDTLLWASSADLYRVHFSQEILDGATRNLIQNKKMTPEKAARFQAAVLKSFPEALVKVADNLVAAMTNHPNDRHVVAAAIASQAEIIVTFNLKDFQIEALAPWNVTAQHPDEFLTDLCDLHGIEPLAQIIQQQVEDLKRPPVTMLELLEKLHQQTPNFASRIVTYFWGKEVEATARKYIKLMVDTSNSSHRSYSGVYYDLCLVNSKLIITAKDDRGQVLISNTGKLTGRLTPEDVKRFQNVKETLASSLFR